MANEKTHLRCGHCGEIATPVLFRTEKALKGTCPRCGSPVKLAGTGATWRFLLRQQEADRAKRQPGLFEASL